MENEERLANLYANGTPYRHFLDVGGELNRIFIEREEVVYLAMATLLIRHNLLLISEPGEAKSNILDLFAQAIGGARYLRVQLFKSLPADFVIGAPDIIRLREDGVLRYRTEGMLSEAHLAFLDEVGDVNPTVAQAVTSIVNPAERIFVNAGERVDCPMHALFSAVNPPLPDLNDDRWFKKLYDRYLFRLIVDTVREKRNFLKLLRAQIPKLLDSQIGLEDLRLLQEAVPLVVVPPELDELRWVLKERLDTSRVWVSSRRWHWTTDAIRASAFLAGRVIADVEDLMILRHVLWSEQNRERPLVAKIVTEVALPQLHAALGQLSYAVEQLELAKAGDGLQERRVETQRIRSNVEAFVSGARPGYEREQIEEILATIDKIAAEIEQLIAAGSR